MIRVNSSKRIDKKIMQIQNADECKKFILQCSVVQFIQTDYCTTKMKDNRMGKFLDTK